MGEKGKSGRWERGAMAAGGSEGVWRRVAENRNGGRWESRGMVAGGNEREWRVVEEKGGDG